MYTLVIFLAFSGSLYASSYQRVFDGLRPIIEQAQHMPSTMPRIARHFCRIITDNKGQCNQVSHAALNMLMNRHYTQRWATAPSLGMSLGDNNLMSFKTPLEKFHDNLVSRFDKQIGGNIQGSLQCSQSLVQKDQDSLDLHYFFDQESFVDRHQIVLKDFYLPSPLMVVAFFDKNAIQAKQRITNQKIKHKIHNYFVPIEQALLMTKRQQILDRLALLEGCRTMLGGWGVNYTGSALGYIPSNVKITGSIGLVASQTYTPQKKDDLRKVPGGATQFYIAKADGFVSFLDINVIQVNTQNGIVDNKLHLIEELERLQLFEKEESEIFIRIRDAFDQYP